jgi:hypothetical protein
MQEFEIDIEMAPINPELFDINQSMKHIHVFGARLLRENKEIYENLIKYKRGDQ